MYEVKRLFLKELCFQRESISKINYDIQFHQTVTKNV